MDHPQRPKTGGYAVNRHPAPSAPPPRISLQAECARMDRAEALALAQELVELFNPVCRRIEIAGSIRRKKETDIKDIELVMEPIMDPVQTALFDDQTDGETYSSRQFAFAQELRNQGILTDRVDRNGRAAFGERLQRVIYKNRAVDLFIVLPPAQWGVKLLLATGPAEFNRRIVTQKCEGGRYLKAAQHFANGALYDMGKLVETPTEEDVFNFLNLRYLPPEERI